MKEKNGKFHIRWGWLCLSVLLLAGMIYSVGISRCFRADDTGNFYRKRIILYLLPAVLLLLISFFRREKKGHHEYAALTSCIFMMAAIALGMCAFQRITCEIPHRPQYVMEGEYALITLSITAAFFMGVWLLIWNARIAALCGYWFLCLAGYGYYCISAFRGDPFHPLDILSIGAAFSVAGQFEYPLVTTHLFWLAWGCVLSAVYALLPGTKVRSHKVRLGKLLCVAVAFGWMAFLLNSTFLADRGISMTAWHESVPDYNRKQGTLTTLTYEVTQLFSQKPDGYDPQAIAMEEKQMLEAYSISARDVRPNVIVIMNEAFSDIPSLWNVETESDVLPYLHGLKENVIYGNNYVSVYGGGTCNTEFSFLTGTPPVPEMNIPMMTVIRQKTPSLAWQLRSQGYTTIAFHPYAAENYRRDEAYPLLGFEKFLSLEDVPDAQQIRGYVSDQGGFDVIWDLYKQKARDERLFVFNVTMQNHCPYEADEDIAQIVELAAGTDDAIMEAYLNSIAYTDLALRELTARFEQEEEPTIILLFGDHQPQMDKAGYVKNQELSALENKLTDYITPFVMWANYPIEEQYLEAVSVHYLSALLLEQAGLALTPYDEWLLETVEQYPVVHLLGYADSAGEFTAWEEKDEWPPALVLQQSLRYNRLNDHSNRLPGLEALLPDT